jgi:hypothetical protein
MARNSTLKCPAAAEQLVLSPGFALMHADSHFNSCVRDEHDVEYVVTFRLEE